MSFWNSNVYFLTSPIFVLGIGYLFVLWLALLCKIKYLSHKTRTIYLFIRNTNILCFTSCLFCGIIDIIHISLAYGYHDAVLADRFNKIKASADILYFLASITLSIILFGRVYYTFVTSIFALSQYTIFIILLQIFLTVIVDLCYSILIVIFKESIIDKYAQIMFLIIIANDICVSISLLYLFVFKLKELIININMLKNGNAINTNNENSGYKYKYHHKKSVSISTNNGECHSNNDINASINSNELSVLSTPHSLLSQITAITLNNIEFDDHQLNLIVVITRHTILSIFAIIFNQVFYIVSYCSLHTKWEENDLLGIIVYASRLCGMCGILTCLYLSMKFSKNIYYQICAFCHLTCYKCCIKCTKNSIKNSMI